MKHKCPIFYPGDIFHKWNSPPELINFALDHLPAGHGIPGQHDLPLHQYEDIRKSAYWTLTQAGVVHNLTPKQSFRPFTASKLVVWPFPWGTPVIPLKRVLNEDDLNVAIIHKYIWIDNNKYPDAPREENAMIYASEDNRLSGYKAAFFGDNHKGFMVHADRTGVSTHIVNCGGFYNSKSDEKDYKPRIWILYEDGSIQPHFMDTSEDKWEAESLDLKGENPELLNLIESIDDFHDVTLDFAEILKRQLDKIGVSKSVRRFVLKWLEGV